MNNQRGISYLEVLITLTIMALISSVIILQFQNTKTTQEYELFLDQLQRDFNWALHYADLHQRTLHFTIAKERSMYYFQIGTKTLLKRTYSNKFRVENNLNKNSIMFMANGEISNFGKLEVYDGIRLVAILYIEMNTGVIREEKH